MTEQYPIRVLIADDHAVLRAGLRHLLDAEPDLVVVGETGDGAEVEQLARSLDPDVVIMDVAMPGLGGLACTKRLKEALPRVAVLVLSMYDNREYVRGALAAGASGYILKKTAATELIVAIRAVRRGDLYLDPSVAKDVVSELLPKRGTEPKRPGALTERETEVLTLVAQGHTNRRVAELLSISVKTVEAHRSSIAAKLGIKGRAPLVRYALQMGLLARNE